MLAAAADGDRTGPTVSVVVCAYATERWPLLERAVRSLQEQTRPADEVVVVVDHNAELLRRAHDALPSVRVVSNADERGLSGARNTGVAHSRGEIVAFLDDDARAEPEWLARMVRHYDDPAVIGVGSLVQARWAEGRPAWYPLEYEWVVGCSYRGQPTTVAEVRNPIGAGMSFRRRVFEEAGGFSTAVGRVGTLPVGCEETELAIRARRRWPGAKILTDPSAVVEHLVPAHRATVRYLLVRCWSEGLSKAAVARIAGPGQALAAERSYVARTLVGGVVRELAQVRGRGDVHRLARAAAMCAGLGAATGGYLRGRLTFPRPTAPLPSAPLRTLQPPRAATPAPWALQPQENQHDRGREDTNRRHHRRVPRGRSCLRLDALRPARTGRHARRGRHPDGPSAPRHVPVLRHRGRARGAAGAGRQRSSRGRGASGGPRDDPDLHRALGDDPRRPDAGAPDAVGLPPPRARRAADQRAAPHRRAHGRRRRGHLPRRHHRLPRPGHRVAGGGRDRQDQHDREVHAARRRRVHGRRLGLPVRGGPAPRLRQADVHQAAPPRDLPAPVRRPPQAHGARVAVAAGRPPHDDRPPLHRADTPGPPPSRDGGRRSTG